MSTGKSAPENSRGLRLEDGDLGVALKDAVRFFRDLTQPILQEKTLLLHLHSRAVPGNPNGLSPDEDHTAERKGDDEMVPGMEGPFPGGAVGQGKDRTPGQAGQLDHSQLDDMRGPLGAIGSNGQVAFLPVKPDHSPKSGKTPARGRAANRMDAQISYQPGDEFSVPVPTDEHSRFSRTGKEGHHEESLMPESPDDRLALIPGFLKPLRIQRFFPDGERKQAKDQRAE